MCCWTEPQTERCYQSSSVLLAHCGFHSQKGKLFSGIEFGNREPLPMRLQDFKATTIHQPERPCLCQNPGTVRALESWLSTSGAKGVVEFLACSSGQLEIVERADGRRHPPRKAESSTDGHLPKSGLSFCACVLSWAHWLLVLSCQGEQKYDRVFFQVSTSKCEFAKWLALFLPTMVAFPSWVERILLQERGCVFWSSSTE